MKTAEKVASHTPGPWEAKPENMYIPAQVWSDGCQLAEVYGENRAARKANACLMAAAPEMLEAAQDLCLLLPTYPVGSTGYQLIERFKAAIRKARGDQ